MSRKYTLGGERLGSGNKLEVEVHGWGKSTHNLDQKLKTTVSAGTLVPFIVEPILPGDEIKMRLSADVMTEPTNGALFGSFKFQADVFVADTRLYNGMMHNNKLRVATNIEQIKMPLVRLKGRALDLKRSLANQQVNSSSLMSYLGIRGIGMNAGGSNEVRRDFNALGFLMYWDVYKNYYASKQENIGAVVHSDPEVQEFKNVNSITIKRTGVAADAIPQNNTDAGSFNVTVSIFDFENITVNYSTAQFIRNIILIVENTMGTGIERLPAEDIFQWGTPSGGTIIATMLGSVTRPYKVLGWAYAESGEISLEPKITTFPLENIDKVRETILVDTKLGSVIISSSSGATNYGVAPFNTILQESGTGVNLRTSLVNNQEGLGIKTYQSDIFNAWLKTDFIEAINNSSAIAITNDTLFLDQINLSKKVYEHLNRLAVTAGTYRDYIAVSYDVAVRDIEIPIYIGGLSKEIVFQEVVSNAETADKPLGTIGGRGTFTNKNKGGFVEYKAYDYGTLMGIMSITPRVDYTQGNKWFNNLLTLKDYHIPAMDGIGYQDLITDQMAYFDTTANGAGTLITRSAGKQPAWLNYMTSNDRALGKFATEELGWMILDRDYEHDATTGRIKDLTQYVDPKKYNKIFAQASRDAMNFWVLMECNVDIRRVMSAKQIPSF